MTSHVGILWLSLTVVACANAASDGSRPDARDQSLDAPYRLDAVSDATTAGLDASPIACGNTTCRNDQACEQGQCIFACVGTTVPGDYATLQSAVSALAGVDRDATICLTAPTYNETVLIQTARPFSKTLTIMGRGMDATTFNGMIEFSSGWSELTMRGFSINTGHLDDTSVGFHALGLYGLSSNTTPKANLIAMKLAGYRGLHIAGSFDVSVDGCDVRGGSYAINISNNRTTPTSAQIVNSYLHSSRTALGSAAGPNSTNVLRLINNLLDDVDVGVYLTGRNNTTIVNNLLTGARGEMLWWDTSSMVSSHHNALWNNVTNYAGSAVEGAATIKTDCQLDRMARIPTLRPSSPCRNAGSAAEAPLHDFWFSARTPNTTPPDLGPVEVP